MGIMKNGPWIGSLLLAVLTGIAEVRGEDVQWQTQSEMPPTETSAVTLAPPIVLPPQRPVETMATPPLPGGLLPVSFETPAPAVEPAARRVAPDIIAVSAPVVSAVATQPAAEPEEEQTDTLFAADRPFRGTAPARRSTSGIVQTSATVAAPAPVEVPLVTGWDAPVDASWGAGVPTGPFPEALNAPPGAAVNPLHPRLYVAGEYLLWWVQGQQVPVLATTSAPADFGVLGAPTTQVLFGGNQINTSPYSGGRFTVGYWLGCDNSKAVEFTGFFLGGPNSSGFVTNSSMNPVIGRPFLEANNGQETAQLTSLPGVTTGTLSVSAPSSLWGLEGNLRCLLCCGCNYRVSALAGFRNLNLNESLTITENIQGLSTAPPPFTNQMITVTDRFATRNNFYGGQVGIDARWYWGRWSVDARGKVALGDTVQLLDISGSQRFVSPTGVVQNFNGGLLALPSNIGHFSNNAFSVVPEIGFNVGYQILPCLRAFVGYNFLYWSNVIRPGTSIDRVIDVTQIPNFPLNPEPAPVVGRHPAPVFHEVGFWAQGITFGLEFVY
jgi:hypothetical protein